MDKYSKTWIENRMAWEKERKNDWEKNLVEGSSDLTYASVCTAKILEVEAELKGMTEVLNVLGYNVDYEPCKYGGIKCTITEMEKVENNA